MRIYPSRCQDWAKQVVKCLNIGCYCSLCARKTAGDRDLCAACAGLLTMARHVDRSGLSTQLCAYCGEETVLHAVEDAKTQAALSVRVALDSVIRGQEVVTERSCDCVTDVAAERLLSDIVAPYRYAHPIDGLIKRLKYRHERQLARVLGELLAEAVTSRVSSALPDIIVPMPLYPARQRLRGFNQAQDIAYWAAKRLQVPLETRSVSRVVDTQSLAGLNRQERQHRILGAFRAEDALCGRRIAIVDDVLTTGASARELAREIYDSGAESVELWVLARTSSLRSVR